MDYLVYIRFEDNPSEARKHVLAAERAGGAQYVLDARYEATPGDETAILHEAFDAAFGLNKYITLYRGFPVGQDVRGRKLFTPVGLVWCKDRVELGQMLGLEMSYEIQENFQPTARKLEDEAHPEADVHSPWSEGGAKGIDWTRPTRIQEEGRDWNSKWLEESPTAGPSGAGVGGAEGSATAGDRVWRGEESENGADGARRGASQMNDGGESDVSVGARRPGRNLFAPNPSEFEFDPEAAARAEWNERSRGAGGNARGVDDPRGAGDAGLGRTAGSRQAPGSRADRAERVDWADADRPRTRSPWAPRDDDAFDGRRVSARDRFDDDDYDDDLYDDDGKRRGGAWKWLLAFVICLVGSFLLVYGGARLIAG